MLRQGAAPPLSAPLCGKKYGYGGFAEFVENRFTEDTKEGKEWKFATIEVPPYS